MKILVGFIGLLVLVGYTVNASEGLSNEQKLRVENFKLKSQLLQCQVTMSDGQLKSEQSKLVEEFRQSLGAKNEEVFDWNTLTFITNTTK